MVLFLCRTSAHPESWLLMFYVPSITIFTLAYYTGRRPILIQDKHRCPKTTSFHTVCEWYDERVLLWGHTVHAYDHSVVNTDTEDNWGVVDTKIEGNYDDGTSR